MTYNFTNRPKRRDTGSDKWEQMYNWNPQTKEGVVPLSVADMEFQLAPEIKQGLIDFIAKDDLVLGYTSPTESYLDAVVDWQKRRHGVNIEKEWLVHTPGIIPALNAGVRALSKNDEGIIIFRPVYYPFGLAIDDNVRTEVNVPLIHQNGYYTIDFERFEAAAADPKNKVLIFCNPHNPVGRVWKREELEKIAEICVKYKLYVISDDIWNDIVMPGYEHTYLAEVNEDLKPYLITCTAASKSFNLAGMFTSNIIIEDEELRNIFQTEVVRSRYSHIGTLGYEATKLAYNKGEKWLEDLIDVVAHNGKVVKEFFAAHYPKINVYQSEGTYLQWLDFRALGMTDTELEEFLHQEAQFFTDEGYIFGDEGSGYERINLALPTEDLKAQLYRLLDALKARDEKH